MDNSDTNYWTILEMWTYVCNHSLRAGLRHVRSVRPNRAADFRGPPFWAL